MITLDTIPAQAIPAIPANCLAIPGSAHCPWQRSLSLAAIIVPGNAHCPRQRSLSLAALIVPGSAHCPRQR